MAIFEDTNPHKLNVLLNQIHSGDTVLPDFQRNFVWDPGATQDLIISIANNFPAGSLLRIRNTSDYFAKRTFEGVENMSSNVIFLVLDGQQRLTSLYQAFFGVGDHRYYLDIRKLMKTNEFEEAIFHERANSRNAKRLKEIDAQAEELIMPLSTLKGGYGDFVRWSRKVVRAINLSNDDRVKLEDHLDEIQKKWIQPIDEYQFPVVTLSDTTTDVAVCTIFETLNRTGVKLSVFELLTARFYHKGVRLRDLWATAIEENPEISDFKVDPYYILQSISLVARTSPSCKRSDVLDLKAGDINYWWPQVINGLKTSLRVLKEDCGVLVQRWLPYNTILIPMAATLAKRPLEKGTDAGARREKFVRWFWCAVFGQAYEKAPNTQATRDMSELIAWFDGGEEPTTVSTFKFDPELLYDTTARQRAVYRGVICLLLHNQARDFFTEEPISANLISQNNIDDHHIFPNSFLKERFPNVPTRQRDCVLNRTLIDRATNQSIGNRSPFDYLTEIQNKRGIEKTRTLFSSHFIQIGDCAPISMNEFDKFLEQRKNDLWAQIKLVAGGENLGD